MRTSRLLRSRLENGALAALPPKLLRDIGFSHARSVVERDVEIALARLRNEDGARLVEVAGYDALVVAFLKRRQDPARSAEPFVFVTLGAEVFAGDAIREQAWLKAIARMWKDDAPPTVRFLRFGEIRGDAQEYVKTLRIGGRVAHDRAKPPWVSDRVCVKRAEDLAFHPEYCAFYRDFHRLCPHMAERVPMEPPEVFAEALGDGFVGLAWVDDRLSGVMSAVRMKDFLFPGWYVTEKVIDPRHWGTGLGESLEWNFLRNLPGGEWVTGDVDVANLGSLLAARRNGRGIIGTWMEMPLGR